MTRILDKSRILPADFIKIIPALIKDCGKIQYLVSGIKKDSGKGPHDLGAHAHNLCFKKVTPDSCRNCLASPRR
jgi:hypothetical protein